MSKRMYRSRGVALLMAVIFTSVVLALSLLIGNLAYKQAIISNTASGAVKAFYAADAALECVLYADQQQGLLDGTQGVSTTCGPVTMNILLVYNNLVHAGGVRIDVPAENNKTYCADVYYYKYDKPDEVSGNRAYLMSTGYDVPCAALDTASYYTSRGVEAIY